jgi:hypothetical protein
VDCITAYLRSSAEAQLHSALSPASRLSSSSPLQGSPLARRPAAAASSAFSPAVHAAVASEDEDDVAELVALLTRARLVPASSRRPIAAALCAAGIGSAEALSQVLEHDPMFLSHQVPAVHFAA